MGSQTLHQFVSTFGAGFSDRNGRQPFFCPPLESSGHILEKWLDISSSGGAAQPVYQNGKTLTFRDQPFKWEQLYAAQGDYMVGFIIEDLDGNQYPVYTQITVQ